MSNQFQPLANGEVVSIKDTHQVDELNTYRVSELTAQIRSKLGDALAEWSNEAGIAGEVLRFGSAAWQKGKIRLGLAIEFAPDDGAPSESNLDSSLEGVFQLLAPGEVVYVQNTSRVSELTARIRSQVASALAEWSNAEGIDGEVLRFSSQAWQKGKVRLNLTLKFAPGESQATAEDNSIPPAPNAVLKTGRTTTVLPPTISQQANQAQVMERPTPAIENLTINAVNLQPANPKIESTLEDDHFELGTMSPVTGEIEMNLIDNEGEQSGYTDFDLSASIPEVNLDELVSRSSVSRPSLIDEVWNEMSQPNWPGIGRA